MFRRIKARIFGWKHQPNKAEIDRLSEHYRDMILNDKAVELITKEDYRNLINVAKYADFGRSTAIQAAFCLGYSSGRHELKESDVKAWKK